jgi:Pin2-interacting protein X1
MLGIGAAHQKDPDGVAWKQNKDFENLLRRLNEASAVDEDDILSKGEMVSKDNGEAEKKRKRDKESDGVEERNAKKMRRMHREDSKSKKSKQTTAKVTNDVEDDITSSQTTASPAYIPRHRA